MLTFLIIRFPNLYFGSIQYSWGAGLVFDSLTGVPSHVNDIFTQSPKPKETWWGWGQWLAFLLADDVGNLWLSGFCKFQYVNNWLIWVMFFYLNRSVAYMLHVAPVVNHASRLKHVEVIPVVKTTNLSHFHHHRCHNHHHHHHHHLSPFAALANKDMFKATRTQDGLLGPVVHAKPSSIWRIII